MVRKYRMMGVAGIATCVLLNGLSNAQAATVSTLIDDFSTDAFTLEFPLPGGAATGSLTHETISANILGGRRLSTWTVSSNPSSTGASAEAIVTPTLGALAVSTGSQVIGDYTAFYGNPSAGTTFDVEANGGAAFTVQFLSLNHDLNISLEVVDFADRVASGSITASSAGVHSLDFASFAGFGGTDFTQVKSVELTIATPVESPDYILGSVFTSVADPVPEPGSLALLGIASALALGRRRRRI